LFYIIPLSPFAPRAGDGVNSHVNKTSWWEISVIDHDDEICERSSHSVFHVRSLHVIVASHESLGRRLFKEDEAFSSIYLCLLASAWGAAPYGLSRRKCLGLFPFISSQHPEAYITLITRTMFVLHYLTSRF
jgi:hypothetical protein